MQYESEVDLEDRKSTIKLSTEPYEAACFVIGANDSQFENLKKG